MIPAPIPKNKKRITPTAAKRYFVGEVEPCLTVGGKAASGLVFLWVKLVAVTAVGGNGAIRSFEDFCGLIKSTVVSEA